MARAEVEHEGGGAVEREAGAPAHDDAVVAGAGLAAERQLAAVGELEGTRQPARGAALDHVGQGPAQRACDLGRHHRVAFHRTDRKRRLVGRGAREAHRVDALHGQAQAVIDDDAHQLGERRRAIARAAERGGERGHEVTEGIAQARPAAVDLEEGLDLEQGEDARVLRPLGAGAEQPAIYLLALLGARRHRLGQRGLGMLQAEGDQPQLERMHARDIAAVGQVVGLRSVARVELGEARGGGRLAQAAGEEVGERLRRRCGLEVAEHRGEAIGARAQAVEQGRAHLLGRAVLVLAPESAQEELALAVGEADEVVDAARVVVVLEQARGTARHLVHGVAHELAHQAHEGQVDRGLQRLAQRGLAGVVAGVEVAEAVAPATGEEALARTRREAALQGGLQHRRQAAVGRAGEMIDRPARQAVLSVHLDAAQRRRVKDGEPGVELGDQLEVGGQHAQLGGGAELELAALVDVERLVGGVGLHPHAVAAHGALHQGEAVAHRAKRRRIEHALADQPLAAREGRVGEAPEVVAHRLLQAAVQRGAELGVEAVEAVQRGVEQAGEPGAHRGRALAGRRRNPGRIGDEVAEGERAGERSVAQPGADQAGLGEQAQVGVGGARELLAPAGEIPRGAAVRDHQRHHLTQGPALGDARLALALRRRQQGVHALEIGPEPHPQPVAQAIDLAMPGRGRQRHGVQVVQHQPAADGQGVLAVAVGAHRGRHHLAQLLARVQGDAAGRVAVLLDLGGERAAAGRVEVGIDHASELAERRAREAHPVHRRVERRPRLVEQLAVLDEEQGLGNDRRHVLEARVAAPGIAEAVQRLAAAVEDVQAGARLLGVGREQAALDVGEQRIVEAHLLDEREAARLQALGKARQLGVAEAAVEGAVGGKADRLARPRHQRVVEARGVARELARLQARGGGLVPQQQAASHARHQQRHEHGGAQYLPGMQAAPGRRRQSLRSGRRKIGGHGRADRCCIAEIMRILQQENDTVTTPPQA